MILPCPPPPGAQASTHAKQDTHAQDACSHACLTPTHTHLEATLPRLHLCSTRPRLKAAVRYSLSWSASIRPERGRKEGEKTGGWAGQHEKKSMKGPNEVQPRVDLLRELSCGVRLMAFGGMGWV